MMTTVVNQNLNIIALPPNPGTMMNTLAAATAVAAAANANKTTQPPPSGPRPPSSAPLHHEVIPGSNNSDCDKDQPRPQALPTPTKHHGAHPSLSSSDPTERTPLLPGTGTPTTRTPPRTSTTASSESTKSRPAGLDPDDDRGRDRHGGRGGDGGGDDDLSVWELLSKLAGKLCLCGAV